MKKKVLPIFRLQLSGAVHLPGDAEMAQAALWLAGCLPGRHQIQNLPSDIRVSNLTEQLQMWGASVEREETQITLSVPEKLTSLPDTMVVREPALAPLYAGFILGQRPEARLAITGSCPVSRDFPAMLTRMNVDFTAVDAGEGNSRWELRRRGRLLRIDLDAGRLKKAEKDGLLLLSLKAEGEGRYHYSREPGADHLERLLVEAGYAIPLKAESKTGEDELARRLRRAEKKDGIPEEKIPLQLITSLKIQPLEIRLPGDATLCLPFITAAALAKQVSVSLEGVLASTGRTETLQNIKRMGASVETTRKKDLHGETVADYSLTPAKLMGRKIDYQNRTDNCLESVFPIITGCYCAGETVVRGLLPLRQGPSDLVLDLHDSLKRLRVHIGLLDDGLVIKGAEGYPHAMLDARGNPWLTMAFAVLSLANSGKIEVENAHNLQGIYPGFREQLTALVAAHSRKGRAAGPCLFSFFAVKSL
jgi:5-enolpyruvylshikimate-3-phosphate synthase